MLVPSKQEINKNLSLFFILLIRKVVPSKKIDTFEIKIRFKKSKNKKSYPPQQFLHFHLVPPWM
jgi:hypothetical protein